MLAKLFIIIGLVVDVVGALCIVVPELRRELRFKIQSITPGFAKYERAVSDLSRANPGQYDPSELESKFKILWPLERSYSGYNGVDSLDNLHQVRWDEVGTRLELLDENSEEIQMAGTLGLRSAVQEYVERRYRTRGILLLTIGFILQIVGNLL